MKEEMMDNDSKQIKDMCIALDNIKVNQIVRSKTFMEVAGYPHYENVVSNILSFMFNSNGEHGFDDLWVKSLISCVVEDRDKIKGTKNSNAEREVYTKEGNRIDILINTDDYTICIENKIYASLYNDLQDYNKTAAMYKTNKDNSQEQINIILCIYKDEAIKYLSYTGWQDVFKVVTYSQLFDEVKNNLRDYFYNCDEKWLIYVKDFMETIESMIGDNMEKNNAYFEFYNKYSDTIERLNNESRAYFQKRTEDVLRLLKNEKDILNFHNEGIYKPNNLLWRSVYIDYSAVFGHEIAVETRIDFEKWRITVLQRDGKQMKIKEALNRTKYSEALNKVFPDWGGHYCVDECDIDESNEVVVEKIKSVVKYLSECNIIGKL